MVGRIANFASLLLLTNALGSGGYGIYALVFAIAGLLLIPAGAGIAELVARELAIATKDDGRLPSGLVRKLVLFQGLSLLSVMAVVTAYLLNVQGVSDWSWPIEPAWLLIALVPIHTLLLLEAGILRGLHKVKAGIAIRELVPALAFLLLLIAFDPKSPASALLLFVIGLVVGALTGAIILYRSAKEPADSESAWLRGPWQLYRQSAPFMLMASGYLLNQKADILVLGALATTQDVGVYQASAQFALLIIFPLQMMNALAGPRVARAFQQGDRRELRMLLLQIAALTFATGLLGALVLYGVLSHFSIALLGPDFGEVALIFAVLAVGNLFNLAIGPVGMFLNMARFEKVTLWTMLASAALNVVLNFALIPIAGTLGAATATVISMVVWNTALALMSRKLLGIPTTFELAWSRIAR